LGGKKKVQQRERDREKKKKMGSNPSKKTHKTTSSPLVDSDSALSGLDSDEEMGTSSYHHNTSDTSTIRYSKLFSADELLSITAQRTIQKSEEFNEEISKHMDDEINYINSLLVDTAVNHKKTSYEYRYQDWSSWLKGTATSFAPFVDAKSGDPENPSLLDVDKHLSDDIPSAMDTKSFEKLELAHKGNLARQFAILCVIAGRLRMFSYNATVIPPSGPSADNNYYIYINWTNPKMRGITEEFFRMHWCPRYFLICSFGASMIAAAVIVIFTFIAVLTFISHQYVHMIHG
jgi:hypothetical protein